MLLPSIEYLFCYDSLDVCVATIIEYSFFYYLLDICVATIHLIFVVL